MSKHEIDSRDNKIKKHLWEIDHPYYCNKGNYFSSQSVESYYKSWIEFINDWGNADFDYNLLFRWDWKEENDDGELNFNGDINYRNGKLYLFWMGQRKGYYQYSVIEVCRNDEKDVLEYLRPRLQHLMKLWEGVYFD